MVMRHIGRKAWLAALATAIMVPLVSAYQPQGWSSAVGPTLVNQSGSEVSPADLNGEFLLLYFSASWCPPCRQFLPKLKEFAAASGGKVSVVLMGMDMDAEARSGYFNKAKMPWYSAPFDYDTQGVFRELGLTGIPSVVVLDKAGKIVTCTAVEDILYSPSTALEKWRGE